MKLFNALLTTLVISTSVQAGTNDASCEDIANAAKPIAEQRDQYTLQHFLLWTSSMPDEEYARSGISRESYENMVRIIYKDLQWFDPDEVGEWIYKTCKNGLL